MKNLSLYQKKQKKVKYFILRISKEMQEQMKKLNLNWSRLLRDYIDEVITKTTK